MIRDSRQHPGMLSCQPGALPVTDLRLFCQCLGIPPVFLLGLEGATQHRCPSLLPCLLVFLGTSAANPDAKTPGLFLCHPGPLLQALLEQSISETALGMCVARGP